MSHSTIAVDLAKSVIEIAMLDWERPRRVWIKPALIPWEDPWRSARGALLRTLESLKSFLNALFGFIWSFLGQDLLIVRNGFRGVVLTHVDAGERKVNFPPADVFIFLLM